MCAIWSSYIAHRRPGRYRSFAQCPPSDSPSHGAAELLHAPPPAAQVDAEVAQSRLGSWSSTVRPLPDRFPLSVCVATTSPYAQSLSKRRITDHRLGRLFPISARNASFRYSEQLFVRWPACIVGAQKFRSPVRNAVRGSMRLPRRLRLSIARLPLRSLARFPGVDPFPSLPSPTGQMRSPETPRRVDGEPHRPCM